MRRVYGIAALVAVVGITSVLGGFEDDFTGATLRVDYYHSGTAAEEHLSVDRLRVEGAWPGSRTQLIDTTNLGRYLVEVVDLETNHIIYTRGFASIYGEWETTGEALGGTWRTIPEAVRIPEPRRPFQLRLRKRQPDRSFGEIWQITVDPESRFVDRAAVPGRDVRVIQEHGDPAVKVDLVVLADGYTAAQGDDFVADVRRLMDALFSVEPFASRRRDFNVRAVVTVSEKPGITRPRAGVFQETPLGARYNTFDSERYVLTLEARAWRDIAAAVPYDFVLIVVNERKYGGGGIFRLYSTAAARSAFADYLVIHEFGHHFSGLADEYYTSDVAYEDLGDIATEPWEPNITALLDPAKVKWGDLVVDGTPLPTPWNKAEFESALSKIQQRRRQLRTEGASEEQVEALFLDERDKMTRLLAGNEHAGKVGAFEGAGYRASGLYRSSADCIMFGRNEVGFCAVCSRAIERTIDLYAR
jgi:hypothetical protein